MPPHAILKTPPKRLAVVDQRGCSGCAASPACVSYCETVTARKIVVDAIRLVPAPESPFSVAFIDADRCIGCGGCVKICPWDAIAMHVYEEGLGIRERITLPAAERR